MKYLLRKCEEANFISHCDEGAIFHNSRSELFHIRRQPNISLKAFGFEVFRKFVDAFRAFLAVDRFEPAKAFLREEGGTRSVTEGACVILNFN